MYEMPEEMPLRRIIRESTGTDRPDLAQHVLLLKINAAPVPLSKPRAVVRRIEKDAHPLKLRSKARDLESLHDETLLPDPTGEADAVKEAAAALRRAAAVLDKVRIMATDRSERLMAPGDHKIEPSRDWRPYMVALAAAFVWHDLTGKAPTWRNDQGPPGPFERMVLRLFKHFGFKGKAEDQLDFAVAEFHKSVE